MSKRIEKIDEQIKQKISQIINREIELPAEALVTITRVESTSDLKHAKIWISVTPIDKSGVVYGKLRDKIKELRGFLSEATESKFVPKIQFRVDKNAAAVNEVERLLEEIRKEKSGEAGSGFAGEKK